MKFTTRTARLAYLIHGSLSLLVIGILIWATIASLRLDRTKQLRDWREAHGNKVRSAMYQMENWANPMLYSEFLRSYRDYSPFSFPDTEQVRLTTGEMLAQGAIVEPSPLLMDPPLQEWIVLHFQVSPRGGYRSPQMIPEEARGWPEFEDTYDSWPRDRFERMLASLEYAYTVDELMRIYEESWGETPNRMDAETMTASTSNGDRLPAQGKELTDSQSDYARQKVSTAAVQRAVTPRVACAPQQLAAANIHALQGLNASFFSNEIVASPDFVGIMVRQWVPVWLRLGNRPVEHLAFLRTVHADGETALQGFVIDWPLFCAELLHRAQNEFPNAALDTFKTVPVAASEDIFGYIPARLVTHESESVTKKTWNSTHSFLLVGWAASIALLAALSVVIFSLVSLSDRRSQFAYAVTHELRTPLTTFRLYTDMLAQGLVGDKDRQEYLDTLNDESQRLADLVSGVLEYSRIENNSVPINRDSVTIGEILEAIHDNYAPRCENAGMELRIDRAVAEEDVLVTDRQHVVQIIGNLVDNACKYGRRGDGSTVKVTVNRRNGMYQFDVVDEGPGIPQGMRTAIFKPYRRGASESAPATGGIGLGLALSRSWAQLLGGHLDLLPTPHGACGARFRFSVPGDDPN